MLAPGSEGRALGSAGVRALNLARGWKGGGWGVGGGPDVGFRVEGVGLRV